MSSESDRKIQLRVSNQKAYVWDVDDIAVLRSQHHICGVLAGTLPHLSQQNVFLGLPLLLMPEEVVLLLENQIAVLIDDPNAHRVPSTKALQSWNAERQASIQWQIATAEAKEASEKATKLSTTDEALRKRKEREEKRAAAARAKALAEGLEPEVVVAPNPPVPAEDRSSTPSVAATPSYTVTIPASSSSLEWYAPDASAYASLEAARAAGIWNYPSDLHERAKCAVFRTCGSRVDLWEVVSNLEETFLFTPVRITLFSARFHNIIYVCTGDPTRYHSHFVASVINSPTTPIRPMEVVAHGRLGTATKKSHLFCEWDNEKQEVSYLSVEWAGFG
ncbi:putative tRNA-splicing endonuclease subunit tsp-4 [Grifola frondosa]|uniref:tRNA-splicing endonuclease subunit Sen34 n=1 Tax=Grifola frondosa TaxID=5627 RepID=A0A1C7MEQ9_GRIFR|nr:putative tRNA-splicing endonuclease subunit tsp-4 [Grifola frondosa]